MTHQEEQKLDNANLHELTAMLDKISRHGIDEKQLNDYLDLLLTLRVTRSDDDLQSQLENSINVLDNYRVALYRLFNKYSNIILERKREIYAGHKVIDMNQPKYTVTAIAEILGMERQTINNWTKGKGGYIKSFKMVGRSKYILESDLKAKFRDLHGSELVITDELRNEHQYRF